jgi:hypothetical protein
MEPRKRRLSRVPTRSAHAAGHIGDAGRVRRRRPRRGRRPRPGPQHWVRHPGGPASGLARERQGRTGHPRGTSVVQGAGSRTAAEDRGSLRTKGVPGDRRSWGREGSGSRGTWRRKPGGGDSAGVSCHLRSAAYGRHRRVPARSPEAGARCGSAARRERCGGCRVTGIPTATFNALLRRINAHAAASQYHREVLHTHQ